MDVKPGDLVVVQGIGYVSFPVYPTVAPTNYYTNVLQWLGTSRHPVC